MQANGRRPQVRKRIRTVIFTNRGIGGTNLAV